MVLLGVRKREFELLASVCNKLFLIITSSYRLSCKNITSIFGKLYTNLYNKIHLNEKLIKEINTKYLIKTG